MRGADHAHRGAIARGGQSARIAVGEDARAGGDQRRAVRAHGPVGGEILVEDGLRLREEARADLVQRPPAAREDEPPHALQGPEEVDRGGARGAEPLDRLLEVGEKPLVVTRAALPCRERHAEGGRHADGGRAADHEGADAVGHFRPGGAAPLDLLDGEPGLVHEDQPVAGPAEGRDHRRRRVETFTGPAGPGPAGAPSLRRTAPASSERMRKSLSRAAAPRTSSTVEGATPSAAARSRVTARLARPSWGGAATRTRSASSRHPTTSSRAAPGCTRTRSSSAILSVSPPSPRPDRP